MSYRINAVERGGHWVAQAQREDTGRPFGIECAGASRAEAIDRLSRWLEWQREHTEALAALQAATRAHHRVVAGTFAQQAGAAAALGIDKESLEALDAARIGLDDIRSRRPEPSG